MARAYIESAELIMPEQSLTTTVDQKGVFYRLPVCCINDPLAYDKNTELQRLSTIKAKQTLINKLKIKCLPDKDVEFDQVDNQTSILDLKKLYIEKLEGKGEGL